jgi:allene oxide cyclase
MTRKLGIVGAVVVLSALGFGLGAASGKSGIASPITLTVFEHSTTDKVIDVGKKGDSTGDILTFHNNLYDETDTTKAGTLQGQCVRESPRAGTWECWWTMSLADGQVTVEGPFSDTSNTVFAVTGGTGLYENARGSMSVKAINGGAEYEQTFHLIP